MRYVVLDTETTGLNVDDGHRVIEIGCVEIENRSLTGREYHQKVNPVREVDKGAEEIHGMNAAQLKIYPKFESIVEEFIEFIEGTTLIIHNAGFDKGFLDAELARVGKRKLSEICNKIIDSLKLARELHPMKKASLDALCIRYGIDRSMRNMHGAILDARLLADVYLAMTRGQEPLIIEEGVLGKNTTLFQNSDIITKQIYVRRASSDEEMVHEQYMEKLKNQGKA